MHICLTLAVEAQLQFNVLKDAFPENVLNKLNVSNSILSLLALSIVCTITKLDQFLEPQKPDLSQ